MEAKTYTLCLIGDDVRDEFLAEIGDSYNILSVYKNIPSVLKVSLSETEREELLNHPYVMEIEEERTPYPASLFTFDEEKTITVQAPNSSEPGSNYINAIHKYFTNGVSSSNPNGVRTVGLKGDFFQPSMPDCNYRSYLTGEHVDIVTIEVGAARASDWAPLNHHKNHPDYFMPGTSTTRCVPMNWKNYNSNIESTDNIDQSSQMLTNHGAGVLSCAGGQFGGLAKKASLRQFSMTSRDSMFDAIDTIKSWHSSKPTNSVTGKKNPTIVVGEWQYLQSNATAIKIKDIASFTVRGTTTNRPGSDRNPELNGWKLSDFVEKNMLPKLIPAKYSTTPNDPYEWAITFDSSGSYFALRNAIEGMISDGIHWICATGNDCGVFSKYDSSDYDNKITTTSTYDQHFLLSYYNPVQYTNGPQDFFIHRSFGPAGAPNAIDVGARQRSEETPATDGYSSRGPVVDIFGLGRGTWSSYPVSTYADGNKYGIFSGTSAATPTVVGVAACILEYQYLTSGSYPSPATLKNLLLGAAKSNGVQNYETLDWDATVSPAAENIYKATNLVDDYVPAVVILPNTSSFNGAPFATDLVGASPRAAFLPDFMRTYNPDTGSSLPDPTPPADVPGACIHPTIKGPTGLVSSPPYNYAQAFDKYRSGSRSPDGIYFTPSGDSGSATDLSYVAYRLRFRGFGPRGGSEYSNGETIYLTSNRGNRDPNKGTVRKWYTQHQSVVDREPDKYTTNKNEAFVPFRIHFRLGFICEGDGAYRILYSDHYHDWYSFEYKDIDFDSTELARQNNISRDGDKLIFPDFSTKTYSQPRIFELKADIYNLDLNPGLGEAKNRINMFAEATRDDTKARESNFTEFGKYIIT